MYLVYPVAVSRKWQGVLYKSPGFKSESKVKLDKTTLTPSQVKSISLIAIKVIQMNCDTLKIRL